MMILRICLLLSIVCSFTNAVVNKDVKRREAPLSNSYGPPPSGQPNTLLPVPIYGTPLNGIKYPPPPPDIPPPVSQPHNKYGLPSSPLTPPPHLPPRQPHREYGVPPAKYGPPPKINLAYGAPLHRNPTGKPTGFGQTGFGHSGKGGSFHDQVKTHFGVQKPVYGPPHFQKPTRPINSYGPPPSAPGFQKPIKNGYFPPQQNLVHIQTQKFNHGPPPPNFLHKQQLPQPLPLHGPKPSSTYGPPHPAPPPPPPLPPKRNPSPLYGPPSTSYGVPDNSISLGAPGGAALNVAAISAALSLPQNQVQFQFEGHGGQKHNGFGGPGGPTVSCDGWRPIPGPVGGHLGGVSGSSGSLEAHHQTSFADLGSHSEKHFVQNQIAPLDSHHGAQIDQNIVQNHIESTNNLDHGQNLVFNGLTDDQIIAVALQSGFIDNSQNSFTSPGGVDLTNSIQQLNTVDNSYNQPPPDSYAPNSIYAAKYNTLNAGNALVPPADIYGSPDASKAGLGIQYGSESGNLRPWLNSGSAPRTPVSFRAPVPTGLLESIGHSVKHLDQFGVKPDNSNRQYIPPPSSEVAQHHLHQHQQQHLIQHHHQQQQQQQQYHQQQHQHHQEQQQLHFGALNDQNLHSYASEHVAYQALPAVHEARFNQPQDCGHGPNLVGANLHYDFGATNQQQGFNNDIITNGNYIDGPDNSGYESKQNSVAIQQSVTPAPTIKDTHSSDTQPEELPGLDGLNIVSAQKSQSVTIPVQGQLGSYQLQFQNANGIHGGEGQANHEQILSEGLLQSILSAIEQPNGANKQQDQQKPQQNNEKLEERVDHKDAEEFLNSPKGKEVLAEPKTTTI